MAEKLFCNYRVISSGANRVCVQSPDDKDVCLKFECPDPSRKSGSLRRVLMRFFYGFFNVEVNNALEYKAYSKLKREIGEPQVKHRFAECYGFVSFPEGRALASQLIRNSDGSRAVPLSNIDSLKTAFSLSEILSSIDELSEFLIKNNIPLFDINTGNLVVVDKNESPFLVVVDAKSIFNRRELIPLSSFVNYLMHKKILRRVGRLKNIIENSWICNNS